VADGMARTSMPPLVLCLGGLIAVTVGSVVLVWVVTARQEQARASTVYLTTEGTVLRATIADGFADFVVLQIEPEPARCVGAQVGGLYPRVGHLELRVGAGGAAADRCRPLLGSPAGSLTLGRGAGAGPVAGKGITRPPSPPAAGSPQDAGGRRRYQRW